MKFADWVYVKNRNIGKNYNCISEHFLNYGQKKIVIMCNLFPALYLSLCFFFFFQGGGQGEGGARSGGVTIYVTKILF